jgi:hypothetical protein
MLDLSVLPRKAQDELLDFYQFLVERYGKKGKKNVSLKKMEVNIDAFFENYNIDLKGFTFNRDEIYE